MPANRLPMGMNALMIVPPTSMPCAVRSGQIEYGRRLYRHNIADGQIAVMGVTSGSISLRLSAARERLRN
jgi:hypothetical protein